MEKLKNINWCAVRNILTKILSYFSFTTVIIVISVGFFTLPMWVDKVPALFWYASFTLFGLILIKETLIGLYNWYIEEDIMCRNKGYHEFSKWEKKNKKNKLKES